MTSVHYICRHCVSASTQVTEYMPDHQSIPTNTLFSREKKTFYAVTCNMHASVSLFFPFLIPTPPLMAPSAPPSFLLSFKRRTAPPNPVGRGEEISSGAGGETPPKDPTHVPKKQRAAALLWSVWSSKKKKSKLCFSSFLFCDRSKVSRGLEIGESGSTETFCVCEKIEFLILSELLRNILSRAWYRSGDSFEKKKSRVSAERETIL